MIQAKSTFLMRGDRIRKLEVISLQVSYLFYGTKIHWVEDVISIVR